MRAGEIAALKGDSIIISSLPGKQHLDYIWVRRSMEQKTGVVVGTTKNGENRQIPIAPQLRAFLSRAIGPDEYVFGGSRPIDTGHLSRSTKKILGELGFPELTFHQLRHSACSYWEFLGMERRLVSEIMGHRSIQTTERYSHVKNTTVANAFQRAMERSKQISNNISESSGLTA